MMLLSVTFGSETFRQPDRTVKIQGFHKKNAGEDIPAPLYVAARDPHSGIRERKSEFNMASAHNPEHGNWVESTYDVPEANFVKLWVQHKYETDVFYDTTFLMLIVRNDSGLRRLGIKLSQHDKALRSWAYVEGKFDVVEPEWFERMGLSYMPNEQYAGVEYLNVSDNFRLETTEAGSPFHPPQVREIITESGNILRTNVRSRRVIRLPRR